MICFSSFDLGHNLYGFLKIIIENRPWKIEEQLMKIGSMNLFSYKHFIIILKFPFIFILVYFSVWDLYMHVSALIIDGWNFNLVSYYALLPLIINLLLILTEFTESTKVHDEFYKKLFTFKKYLKVFHNFEGMRPYNFLKIILF